MKKRLKIGLALGSGGARGMAHLGVLRAFQEAGLKVDVVAGTSIGALVGMGLAADRLEAMREVVLHMDWRRALHYFVEARLPHSGLIDGARVLEFIRLHARDRRLEDLDIPCGVVATDLASGEEVVLDRGETAEAIRASIAVPGLFTPVNLAGRLLVDGGLVNPVPVNVARRLGADVVIAVDVAHFEPLTLPQMAGRKPAKRPASESGRRLRDRMEQTGKRWRAMAARSFLAPMLKAIEAWEQEPGLFDVMGISMRIVESQIAEMRFRTEPPDCLIRPALGNIFFMEFHRAPEIEEVGYQAAKKAMPEILKACGARL
jgi:NTE family protein